MFTSSEVFIWSQVFILSRVFILYEFFFVSSVNFVSSLFYVKCLFGLKCLFCLRCLFCCKVSFCLKCLLCLVFILMSSVYFVSIVYFVMKFPSPGPNENSKYIATIPDTDRRQFSSSGREFYVVYQRGDMYGERSFEFEYRSVSSKSTSFIPFLPPSWSVGDLNLWH